MSKDTTVFVSGKIYWAKIVGYEALTSNYEGDGKEWKYELVPNDTSFLKEHKLLDRLKEDTKGERGDYLSLKRPEFFKDRETGELVRNKPLNITDADNTPWYNRLIGNGSDVDVKLKIADYGPGKKKAIYTQAIRVTTLVPYSGNAFSGMDTANAAGDDVPVEQVKKPATKPPIELDDLDDEIPF